jgi:hypothetical protein
MITKIINCFRFWHCGVPYSYWTLLGRDMCSLVGRYQRIGRTFSPLIHDESESASVGQKRGCFLTVVSSVVMWKGNTYFHIFLFTVFIGPDRGLSPSFCRDFWSSAYMWACKYITWLHCHCNYIDPEEGGIQFFITSVFTYISQCVHSPVGQNLIKNDNYNEVDARKGIR